MTDSIAIRTSVPADLAAIETLYPDAFPNEDLLPLVMDLMQEAPITLSLVGITNSLLVGHVIFTECSVAGSRCRAALLGPLAVASAWQGMGFGSAIVRSGLQQMRNNGITQVYVLGDPAFYGRFGFAAEPNVAPPYPLPTEWREAWQSMCLGKAEAPRQGTLSVPRPWRQPALWAP